MVVLVAERGTISYNATDDLIMQANHTTLARQNLVALKDHPDVVSHSPPPRSFALNNTNGKYVLVFVQRLSKILEATEYLSRAGYYQSYSREELEVLINWRSQLVDGD